MNFRKVSIILCFVILTWSEKTWSQAGYVMIDSSYSTGFIESQGKKLNYLEAKFRKSPSSPVTTYYPTTASEYSFNNQVYRSREISTDQGSKTYFLYVLSKGNTSLYTIKVDGKQRFFAETGKEFTELKKDNGEYREQIDKLLTGCDQYKDHLPYLRLKEKSLRRFFALHNSCYTKGPWPLSRWSAFAGFSSTSLTITNTYGEEVKMGTKSSPVFGIGTELPLGTRPNWSIVMQLMYQKTEYEKAVRQAGSFEVRNSQYDIEVSAITVPFLFKYSVTPMEKLKVFFIAGPSVTYNSSKSQMDEVINRQNGTITNEDSSDLVSAMQVNATGGLGLEYYLNNKISISLDARYVTGTGLGEGQSVSSKQFVLGINF